MSLTEIRCGFIPLVDAAPLVVMRELGFAEEEGLDLRLLRQPSWSTLRDMLALGHLEAAHMLSPVPVAMSLGLGGLPTRMDALMVLSVNGNTIGVSPELATRMRAAGWAGGFADPVGTGNHLIRAAGARLRVGVPFPFSMHAELLYHWLGSLGLSAPGGLDVRTIPPPRMGEAMAADEIDAFCVGEPWGSAAVERGAAELVLPGSAIWSFAPEKVLAAGHDWVEANPGTVGRLMRAAWRAQAWLGDGQNIDMASDLLARTDYLDIPDEIIDRALMGRIQTRQGAAEVKVPRFLCFHEAGAAFPWRSQAALMGRAIARRSGLEQDAAMATARAAFRSDLYRANLAPIGVDLPGASEKLEGALSRPTPVASSRGGLTLGPDSFFDGWIFDPHA